MLCWFLDLGCEGREDGSAISHWMTKVISAKSMSLCERMCEVLSQSKSEDLCLRDVSLPVWHLVRPSVWTSRRRERTESVTALKIELLSQVLTSTSPVFIVHQEPPDDYEVPGNWQRTDDSTWRVPADLDLTDSVSKNWLLGIGNWCLYSAPAPVVGICPDAFRMSASELLSWMRENSVAVLIDSFHDDSDWVVALGVV